MSIVPALLGPLVVRFVPLPELNRLYHKGHKKRTGAFADPLKNYFAALRAAAMDFAASARVHFAT